MEKIKEEMLEKLRALKEKAQKDINLKEGYENFKVKNVIHYKKKVELVNKETGEKEFFDLCVVVAQNDETQEVLEIYYLNGEEADFSNIMRKYESATPIKDVVDATRENEEKPEQDKNKDLGKDDLEELELEKEKEEAEKKSKNEDEKNNKVEPEFQTKDEGLTGKKPKYVMQTVDIDKAYIDNHTTVRRGFGLPSGVEKIAIAKPMQKDENVLSSEITMYMLDNNGNIVQEVNGKTIEDYFRIDDATGNNPMNDENTKYELDGYAERNQEQTMRRFKSKANPDIYLSAEQKKVGEYVEVYAGRKNMDGNDSVEVQLETDNVEIQTSLEMQKIASGYKGLYNIENIDKEVDEHEGHGDDLDKINVKNADGKDETVIMCNTQYIPGTDKTWEELSEITGESITKLQVRFEKELLRGKEPQDILDEIEYDYEMTGHEPERKLF